MIYSQVQDLRLLSRPGFQFQLGNVQIVLVNLLTEAAMAVSVLTSLSLGQQHSFFNASGVESAKYNSQSDAIWTDPFAICIYIYMCTY
jgi:hypothetical protein